MISCLLAVIIELSGVTGSDLRARAFFDANNVTVGDPLTLTVDFIGKAQFRNLHPPKLSGVVSAEDWKIDDSSAKTDTYNDARRLTYRVRPIREGLLHFPRLEFAYRNLSDERVIVKSNEIPVHARAGEQVIVEELDVHAEKLPQPPELIVDIGDFGGDEDLEFAWRKAHAKPSADAFAAFDFPEAKMNEATMAIREGNWSRALSIYRSLEWETGQTPEIECGIVAALALKHDSPNVELPVWRQVMRPLLGFGWKGRVGLTLGAFTLVVIGFWAVGRLIRIFAVIVVIAGVASSAYANTVEESVTTNSVGAVTTTRIVKDSSGRVVGRYSSTVMTSATNSANSNFSFVFGPGGGEPIVIAPRAPRIPEAPTEGRPEDFSGIIATELKLEERCDLTNVGTNDVVQITYVVNAAGYVPPRYEPKDVAFEIMRRSEFDGSETIAYRRYFVADGTSETPTIAISYYDPRKKRFRTTKAGGTRLKYDIIDEK